MFFFLKITLIFSQLKIKKQECQVYSAFLAKH